MWRHPIQNVLGSVVSCQRARQSSANKTTEEETKLHGDVDSSIIVSRIPYPVKGSIN